MSENYMLAPQVRQCFEQWMASPTYFRAPSDTRHFNRFVKACIDRAKKDGAGEKLDICFFKDALTDDVKPKYLAENGADGWDEMEDDIVFRFKLLIEYEETTFPK